MPPEGWEGTGLEVLKDRDFSGTTLQRPGIYAVCFAATWCPPTRRFVPKFVQARSRVPAPTAIADITDLESPLWDTFHIDITPSLVVFRDGAEVGRFGGRAIFGLGEKDVQRMIDLVGSLRASKPGGP